ncbi:LysR family transcriptional regulator [Staphylococcus borealis]|uniref:LysR family transcriptional regulator n=1 Tax=Staphylococcus borealis TaxID=2742203 RepID=UPI000D1F9E8D|nr:LysR family transcriptional regulator [Staphylococcus borealis]PTK67803.1 LysR family transcriptional regulator [Staphylococcus borealis]RIO71996.1 LysR family transcriptional regulator [Staphylococcus borealis]
MTYKNKIQYLEAIQRYGSISHAAKHLYISQPYLSRYIKEVENDLGVTLINRDSNPLELTYSAERFLDYLHDIEDIDTQMRDELQTISNLKKGRIRIGVNPILATHTLYSILPKFIEHYPGVEIELVEEVAHRIEQIVYDQKVDIGVTILPLYTEDLSYDILYTENVYLALPPGHDLIDQAKAHADDGKFPFHLLHNEKFILLKPEMTLRQLTNQILNDYHVVPDVMMETVSVENALRLVNEGIAITFVPKSVKDMTSDRFNGAFVQLNPHHYYNQVVLAYKENDKKRLSRAAKTFIQMAKSGMK